MPVCSADPNGAWLCTHTHTQNLVQKLKQARVALTMVQAQVLPWAAPRLLSTFIWAHQLVAKPIIQEKANVKAAFSCRSTKALWLVFRLQYASIQQRQGQYGVKGPGLEEDDDQKERCSGSRETCLQLQGWESRLWAVPCPWPAEGGQNTWRASKWAQL